jgi:hypothetical protein
MPEPLRLFNNQLVELDDDRIVFRRTASNHVILASAILGVLCLIAGNIIPVSSKDVHIIIIFLLNPGFFLTLVAIFMYGYERLTIIDVHSNRVEARQTIFAVPAQSYHWHVSEFDAVIVWFQTPGRESKPGLYFTLALKGPDAEVSLLDLEDHDEAKKMARDLADTLGLKATETPGG